MEKKYVSPQIEVVKMADTNIMTMSDVDVSFDEFNKLIGQ